MTTTESALRRRIVLTTQTRADGSGTARGALEDDYHHFRVQIRHDGQAVVSATGEALRFPYTACPAATGQLAQLEGMALSSVANSVTRQTDARLQCTHMLELAGLVVAAAARGIARRQYDCTVPDDIDGVKPPRVERDGQVVLRWIVQGQAILEPEPYAGRALGAGFAGWALRNLSEDEAEAALVLRRATTISIGRGNGHVDWTHARPSGLCYSQQPERAESALTVGGTVFDWPSAEPLCADDRAFLAFAD